MEVTAEEIEAGKTAAGGWTRDQLAAWGVPWPPPRGWKYRLINGEAVPPKRLRVPGERHARLCVVYAQKLIPLIKVKAMELGYAIGTHGSMAYDIDLIAAPWTESAVPAKDLAEAIRVVAEQEIGRAFNVDAIHASNPDHFHNGCPGGAPHGRLCWTFHLGGGPYIDLSVMPMHDVTYVLKRPDNAAAGLGTGDQEERA